MTRGNQRDLARAKAQKKLQDQNKKKGADDGMTLEQRRERDANRLREKQAQKAAAAEGGQGQATTSGQSGGS